MNPIIASILQDFSLDDYLPITPRDLDLGEPLQPKKGNLVKVIIGMRRSGKSYRLLQEMNSLMASGVSPERICYFNFEDDRLSPVTAETGDEVLETFRALHPEAAEQGIYLFFDELQEMQNWGSWLRRIVDTNKATIYISGSSSKMLSTQIATEFRGRALDFELLPYSFREIARNRGLLDARGGASATVFSTSQRAKLRNAFGEYLQRGGFPAAQELPEQLAIPLLQSYAQRVVSRDVVERHNISRPRVATAFARRVLNSNGKQLSIRKTENTLRSMGLPTSRELLSDMLSYLEEAYLMFQIRDFSFALSESTTSTPKIYAIDPGLAAANANANINDEGQRLEDAVYLELRRRTVGTRRGTISSYHTTTHGYEIDFVVGDELDGRPYELYQVTESVSDPHTRERELRALWEAMDDSGLTCGTLIVGEGEDATYENQSADGTKHTVTQIPAWKWMLQND